MNEIIYAWDISQRYAHDKIDTEHQKLRVNSSRYGDRYDEPRKDKKESVETTYLLPRLPLNPPVSEKIHPQNTNGAEYSARCTDGR